MGHYRNELDPEDVAVRNAWFARLSKLREKLKDVPLSEFTVSELPYILRLQCLVRNSEGLLEITGLEVAILEKKAKLLGKSGKK